MSLVTVLNNIGNRVERVVEDIVADDQLYHSRVAVCKGCKEYQELTRQCRECGCFVPFKAQVKRSKCPQGKW